MMSSPSEGASQSPSKPAEQPAAKHSKRPTSSLGRHSSSWYNRLHRHHDRKHRSDDDVERPLLANDHLHEEDEEPQDQPTPQDPPPPLTTRPHGLRRVLSATKQHTTKAYNVSRNVLKRNGRHILIACLLALLTLLLSICIGYLFNRKHHKTVFTCQSAACVHAASEILYNLDPKYAELDACTQFDEVVCGGWQQRHDLRPDQGDMFTGTIMAENSKSILRHILEQSSSASLSSPADRDNFKKIKDDYDSCMNEQALQQMGIKPLQDVVNQIKSSFSAKIHRRGPTPLSKIEPSTQKVAKVGEGNQLTVTLLFLMERDITALMAFSVQVSTIGLSSSL